MQLTIENRAFPFPTEEIIKAGLATIPSEGGVALLEDGEGFIQTCREPDGYQVEYRDAETGIFFELGHLLDLDTTARLFVRYLLRDDAWRTDIEWQRAGFQLDGHERSPAEMVAETYLYEVPEPAKARAPMEQMTGVPAATYALVQDVRATSRPAQQQIECARCGSNQITANAKGYGAIKGLAGLVATGPVGLLAGFIGKGKVKVTCLSCGHSWRAGASRR